MEWAVMAIGNPTAVKFAVLNVLANNALFKSGRSSGSSGTMSSIGKMKSMGTTFIDAPGLADDTYREKAGKSISTRLKKGGLHKILFFVSVDNTRLVFEDIATMMLILEAAKEIGNKFGVIVNQIPEETLKGLKNKENLTMFLTKLFVGMKEENRNSNVFFLPNLSELEVDNLPSINGSWTINKNLKHTYIMNGVGGETFDAFVNDVVPEIYLTKDKAKDIETNDYRAITFELTALETRLRENRNFYLKEQNKLVSKLQKLQKDEEERQERRFELDIAKIESGIKRETVKAMRGDGVIRDMDEAIKYYIAKKKRKIKKKENRNTFIKQVVRN